MNNTIPFPSSSIFSNIFCIFFNGPCLEFKVVSSTNIAAACKSLKSIILLLCISNFSNIFLNCLSVLNETATFSLENIGLFDFKLFNVDDGNEDTNPSFSVFFCFIFPLVCLNNLFYFNNR